MKKYWIWFWGIDENNINKRSPGKKFLDFDEMKVYSARHSKKHEWLGDQYWSNYYKKELL